MKQVAPVILSGVADVPTASRRPWPVWILLVGMLAGVGGSGCTFVPQSRPSFEASNVVVGTGSDFGDSRYARQMAVEMSRRSDVLAAK